MEVAVEEGQVWPSRAVVEEVVERSGLVPVVMKAVWRRALHHLFEGRHWVGLALLLPQLECSLRCLFAWANEVPSRVLTAQHTALYTTLDHVLAPRVTGGGIEDVGGGGGAGGLQVEQRESGMIEVRPIAPVGTLEECMGSAVQLPPISVAGNFIYSGTHIRAISPLKLILGVTT
ncbi:Endoplasmic reticulum membrane-associated RNA degradation protein [Portunus trituberculatus]|uniref:Endoplasmic reticulum membrane-associated RNA degradation protein n=1 Tax=Portunus trituberculatus TaxID=210409 RepID=A0A5B7D785_PORTR|nr:Endoplasmic reticulum membrane-associated RNA degradation protein [Portunus trituberculatus]